MAITSLTDPFLWSPTTFDASQSAVSSEHTFSFTFDTTAALSASVTDTSSTPTAGTVAIPGELWLTDTTEVSSTSAIVFNNTQSGSIATFATGSAGGDRKLTISSFGALIGHSAQSGTTAEELWLHGSSLVIKIDTGSLVQWGEFTATSSKSTLSIENGAGTDQVLEIEAASLFVRSGSTDLAEVTGDGDLKAGRHIVLPVYSSGSLPSSSEGEVGSMFVDDITAGGPYLAIKAGASTWVLNALTT